MNPAMILPMLQAIRFGVDTVALFQQGDLTEEELAMRTAHMRAQLEDANKAWLAAGEGS